MNELYASASLLVTILLYALNKKLYLKRKTVLLTPILVTPLAVIVLLLCLHVPYPAYNAGSKWLSDLLGPATVAFAVPIYKHFPLLKKHALEIFVSLSFGSLVAIVSSGLLALWSHLTPEVVESLAPRSVTTPIAMNISQSLGGTPTLTAIFVMVTGLSGMFIGTLAIRYLPIRSSLAKGLMFGMGAHGSGTSRAFDIGELEGTLSSLAMIIAAGVSVVLAPLLVPVFSSLAAS